MIIGCLHAIMHEALPGVLLSIRVSCNPPTRQCHSGRTIDLTVLEYAAEAVVNRHAMQGPLFATTHGTGHCHFTCVSWKRPGLVRLITQPVECSCKFSNVTKDADGARNYC